MEQNDEIKVKSEINLRKLMQKMGMGTNAFATACGVSTQAMAQYLRPGKSITTATIYRIANALDIDPRDMFFPTNENEKENNSYSLNSSDDEQVENAMQESQPVNTTAFCPHCGAKVRVGVVLMTE